MEMEMRLSILSLVVSFFAAIFSVVIYYNGLKRAKKQATLDAFNVLQSQVLDELNRHSHSDFIEVAQKGRTKEFRGQFNDFRSLLARCEHFAVGVNEDIYDFTVVDKLAAAHIIFLYEKVRPIIEETRSRPNAERYYGEFEHLVTQLRKKHPDLINGERK